MKFQLLLLLLLLLLISCVVAMKEEEEEEVKASSTVHRAIHEPRKLVRELVQDYGMTIERAEQTVSNLRRVYEKRGSPRKIAKSVA